MSAHSGRVRRAVGRALVDTSPLRRHTGFRRLWTGQLVASLGSQLTVVAVSYQTFRLTGSTAMVGLVSLEQRDKLPQADQAHHRGRPGELERLVTDGHHGELAAQRRDELAGPQLPECRMPAQRGRVHQCPAHSAPDAPAVGSHVNLRV